LLLLLLLLPAALLTVADGHVRELFHSFCFTNLTQGSPMCVSDEHYVPSLMASYGLDHTTDCQVGGGFETHWCLLLMFATKACDNSGSH
jgi:hypothetical protein